MFHFALRIIAATIWAMVCTAITLMLLAVLFGQSLEGIQGQWQFVPVVGEVAILLAVGIFSFQHGLRGTKRPQDDQTPLASPETVERKRT